MTRILSSILLAFVAIPALSAHLAAQEPTSPQPPAANQDSTTSSAIVQPALDNLQQTLVMLRPEKWKTSGGIGQETQANLTSIQADLQTTLPPLLAVADQHPGSIAQMFPVFRNVSALYDVLLRVTQVALLTASSQQSSALQQSLESLETSRRELGDRLQSSALAQNQQLHDVQAQLRSIQATPPPAPDVCPQPPASTPAKKRKPRPKPAPATTPSAAPQTSAPPAP